MEALSHELASDGETIDEEYEEYLRANLIRDEELFKFVVDFKNSEECHLAKIKLAAKKAENNIENDMECVCTECWEEKIDLVKNAQQIWALEQRFEKFIQNISIKEVVKHQEESIKVIREKIADTKQRYLCHREERELLEEKHRQAVLEDLKTRYHVNTKFLSTKSKPVERVLVYNKIRHVQRVRRSERMACILRRILNEYKRQRQIDDLRNRKYDMKVVRKEKIIEDMEVFGARIILLPRHSETLEEKKEEELQTEEKPHEELSAPEEEKPEKGRKDIKQAKDDKKGKNTKESKSSKEDKKDKKDKKNKKGKEKKGKPEIEIVEFTLPYVPLTNERHKIKLNEDHNMVDLVKQFEAMEDIEKGREKFEMQKTLSKGIFYPEDCAFICFPKVLMFKDFKNRVVYKNRLRILNGGTVEKKCRFNFVALEEFDPNLVQVEPVATQNVIPGMFFYITITFSPETLEKVIQGKIIFLTYTPHKNEYLQISVPIVCTPYCSQVSIAPESVLFHTLPIWEAKRRCNYSNYKDIKISNTGKKACKITISKIRDSFFSEETFPSDENVVIDVNQTKHETSRVKIVQPSSEINEKEKAEPISGTENEEGELFESEEESAGRIIDECVGYVFNAFVFDCYCFNVDAKSERIIRVYFRNVDYVGSYNEKYLMNVYEEFKEKTLECVGSKELMINAEVTGKFIEVSPKTLDFNACVFNSVYQLSFQVYNKATLPHGVGIKFPSCLKKYLSSSENDVYIQPNDYKRISIQFIPREEIVTCNEISYYDSETKILEFPIYVCVMSKNFSGTPPTKVTIFAILTDSNGLCLNPEQGYYTSYINEGCEVNLRECTCESGADYLIDMGECTTHEMVYTELKLTNSSYVFHNFGFMNLPECIKILPNYGFGEIFPMEIKILTLVFSPEAKDIPNYELECEHANKTLLFRVSVNTVKNIGGIKKQQKLFKYKFIRRSLDLMEKELGKDLPYPLYEDIATCLDLLRDEETLQALTIEKHLEVYLEESEGNFKLENVELTPEEGPEEPFMITSNNLWIKATIIDPLCDLSHPYIEFPDTPCGSYSIMAISLRALTNIGDFKCVCGYVKKFTKCKKCIHFNAHFEVVGDNHEISVEPICGDLQSGQEIKLMLVSQPQLPEETVMETAREIKRQQLLQQKRLNWEKEMASKLEKAQNKDTKGNKGKEAKGKGKGKTDKKSKKGQLGATNEAAERKPPEPEPEPMPDFIIDDSEIVVDYYDIYPAEMITWKNMEPYYIEGHFCCTISYTSTNITRKPEKLYFTANCKVVRPDFIHNLKTQHIDFGPIPIGMTSREMISIQNIQCNPINPTLTSLSPFGPFTCASPTNLILLPEHLLQLPITFAPCAEKQETEYFEIKAGKTVCPLIVSGEGVECNLVISPSFAVCRLEANSGGFADCAIEFNNQSKASLVVDLIKICELEGEIKPIEKEGGSKTDKNDKKKKGKDDKKPKKISKFSQELAEEEEVSLQNYFVPKEGESYFEILGATDNRVEVAPFTKKSIKIHFGVPLPPGYMDQKGKKGKKDKSPGSSKKGKKLTGPQKYYVTKFNIMLGNTFLRDAIIIATFV